MTNLYKNDSSDVFSVHCGSEINDTIDEAIAMAFISETPVAFEFNDVKVTVHGKSNNELIYRDWNRAMNGYIPKKVGPDPKAELSAEELASDSRIEAKNEQRRQEAREKYMAEIEAKKKALQSKLQGASEMEFANEALWNETVAANQDDYSKGILDYASRWAKLMQVEISGGKTVAEVAQSTSSEADVDGITAFMYGMAVSILSNTWKHGEELRRWHNLDTQLGNEGEKANEEGGVLNPALLNITL